MLPVPLVTAISVAMPLAPKPSTLPSARPRPGCDVEVVRRGVELRRDQQPPQSHLNPGRGANALALQRREIAADDAELLAHDQEPVHAPRQRAQQPDPAPRR